MKHLKLALSVILTVGTLLYLDGVFITIVLYHLTELEI